MTTNRVKAWLIICLVRSFRSVNCGTYVRSSFSSEIHDCFGTLINNVDSCLLGPQRKQPGSATYYVHFITCSIPLSCGLRESIETTSPLHFTFLTCNNKTKYGHLTAPNRTQRAYFTPNFREVSVGHGCAYS